MIEFTGCVLRAAMECAARPTKERPDYWCSRVRLAAARALDKSVLEATDGVVLMRLTMDKSYDDEAFLTRDIIQRIRPDDRVQVDGLQLEVESETGDFDIRASLLSVPEPALMMNGKNLRQWPDFETIIPKGKRAAASMIGLSSSVIGKVSRACKHLSSAEYPLTLRMEAGGANDPVKLIGRSVFGDAVFCVMPVSIVPEEKGTEAVERAVQAMKDSVPEGAVMTVTAVGKTAVVADKRKSKPDRKKASAGDKE